MVSATQVAHQPEDPKFLEVREEVNNNEAKLMPLFDEINDTLLETKLEESKDVDPFTIPLTQAEATCFARRYPLSSNDPNAYWLREGKKLGLNRNCADRITEEMAQCYLESEPEVQKLFGSDVKAAWDYWN